LRIVKLTHTFDIILAFALAETCSELTLFNGVISLLTFVISKAFSIDRTFVFIVLRGSSRAIPLGFGSAVLFFIYLSLI